MDLGDRITAAYHRLWERAGEVTGHPVERIDGVSLVSTGAPAGFLNRAFVQTDPEDPTGALEEAKRFFGDLPFFFEVRRDLHPRATDAAAARGLEVGMTAPGMVMTPAYAATLETECEGLDIKPVASDQDLEDNLAVQAEGFGMPLELIHHVFAKLLRDDNARCLTGWHDGRPVTTSAVIADDGLAGVYSVATLPDVRGRGFGHAMTAAAIRTGVDEMGCTESYLQSSDMGKGVYERMGYRTTTTYDGYACNP